MTEAARATVWLTDADPATVIGGDHRSDRRMVALDELPSSPFDMTGAAVVLAEVVSDETNLANLLRAAARGVDMVLRIDLAPSERASLIDQLERVAVMVDVGREFTDGEGAASAGTDAGLDTDQIALLRLIAAGASVEEAGRSVGLSRRTAYRRIGAAASMLDATAPVDAARRARDLGLLD